MQNKFSRILEIKQQNEKAGIDLLFHQQNLKTGRPQIITSFNLFQTPLDVVDTMLSLVDTKYKNILEPSAGLGRIISKIKGAETITAIEINLDCCKFLYENFHHIKIKQGDFFNMDLPKFDLCIMNPPFKNGLDIKHILKAKEICKEVVFLCYAGPRQIKTLKPLCEYFELLPANSFKESGTSAGVYLGYIKCK